MHFVFTIWKIKRLSVSVLPLVRASWDNHLSKDIRWHWLLKDIVQEVVRILLQTDDAQEAIFGLRQEIQIRSGKIGTRELRRRSGRRRIGTRRDDSNSVLFHHQLRMGNSRRCMNTQYEVVDYEYEWLNEQDGPYEQKLMRAWSRKILCSSRVPKNIISEWLYILFLYLVQPEVLDACSRIHLSCMICIVNHDLCIWFAMYSNVLPNAVGTQYLFKNYLEFQR